jgi:hypothetical protein
MVDGRAPDGIEPVVGWRAWTARRSEADHPDATWGLHSVAYVAEWPVGAPLRARCRLPRNACRDIPGQRCRCGIYAVNGPVEAYRYMRNPRRVISGTFSGVPIVLGEVALWGRIVVGELGWRGEFGYPRRLFLLAGSSPDDGIVAQRLEDYRVPVTITSRAALFDLHPIARRSGRPLRSLLKHTRYGSSRRRAHSDPDWGRKKGL